ncbi:MAG TPA: hypothetical protein VHE34_07850 [Puia sp.]|uniref:hypothetical protein n=1 Tax=Puia sp. TaxID=2045100 RepID=UPI002B782B49|nr:hypothetical protein [Puia sp.]HVU95119.1 hypothetical protein [Puia sp.]
MRPLLLLLVSGLCAAPVAFDRSDPGKPEMQLSHSLTIDSLGACQGISWQKGKAYLYGDREVGMIREFDVSGDSLQYTGKEYRLTLNDTDVINHPTGLAMHGKDPVFMGNSVLLDRATNKWKAIIYCIDWPGLRRTGTLDRGNLKNVIEDDACIQGTRPEYVEYNHKWYVATADYGNRANEVRLYDPAVLAHAQKTTDKGVLYKKFTCGPWVQNMQWIASKGLLLLIQNQVEGRKWRFTFVDLNKSLETGKAEVVTMIDTIDRGDELEGFSFLSTLSKGVAVTSSRRGNVNFIDINW